jgi:hypothetical protein
LQQILKKIKVLKLFLVIERLWKQNSLRIDNEVKQAKEK